MTSPLKVQPRIFCLNYTTLGYGNVTASRRCGNFWGRSRRWTGSLLFGWSTAVIFEVLRRTMDLSPPSTSNKQYKTRHGRAGRPGQEAQVLRGLVPFVPAVLAIMLLLWRRRGSQIPITTPDTGPQSMHGLILLNMTPHFEACCYADRNMPFRDFLTQSTRIAESCQPFCEEFLAAKFSRETSKMGAAWLPGSPELASEALQVPSCPLQAAARCASEAPLSYIRHQWPDCAP